MTPSPTSTPLSDPNSLLSWVDVSGFWVQVLGVIATSLLAGVTVWLTIRSSRESRRRNLRDERLRWVNEFTDYLNGWVRSSAPTQAVRQANEHWYLGYDELLGSATTLQSLGAPQLLDEARTAAKYISQHDSDDLHTSAEDARTKLLEWASNWLNDPKVRPGKIVEWIDRFKPGGSEHDTD